ncbi:putative membrane protein [Exiguobacterium sp. S17]|nr:putative membrane protein [Exiguobacterium sp. S17]
MHLQQKLDHIRVGLMLTALGSGLWLMATMNSRFEYWVIPAVAFVMSAVFYGALHLIDEDIEEGVSE